MDNIIRRQDGRFDVGNPGGPGHPQGPHLAALRAAFAVANTPADIERLVARLYNLVHGPDAKASVAAADLIMCRLWGKARESVDVDVTAAARPHQPLPDLTPDEVVVLSRVLARS